jgi:hypothetical protein
LGDWNGEVDWTVKLVWVCFGYGYVGFEDIAGQGEGLVVLLWWLRVLGRLVTEFWN